MRRRHGELGKQAPSSFFLAIQSSRRSTQLIEPCPFVFRIGSHHRPYLRLPPRPETRGYGCEEEGRDGPESRGGAYVVRVPPSPSITYHSREGGEILIFVGVDGQVRRYYDDGVVELLVFE